MADPSTAAPSSLNAVPAAGAVAGQAAYENGSAGTHMAPPPVPPLNIPQNNNPIPMAMSGPMSGNSLSPASASAMLRRAAPEPNKRALYVGGLDPRVTEDVLKQIFETTGHVRNVKIIPDKNVSTKRLAHASPRIPACSVLVWRN